MKAGKSSKGEPKKKKVHIFWSFANSIRCTQYLQNGKKGATITLSTSCRSCCTGRAPGRCTPWRCSRGQCQHTTFKPVLQAFVDAGSFPANEGRAISTRALLIATPNTALRKRPRKLSWAALLACRRLLTTLSDQSATHTR